MPQVSVTPLHSMYECIKLLKKTTIISQSSKVFEHMATNFSFTTIINILLQIRNQSYIQHCNIKSSFPLSL